MRGKPKPAKPAPQKPKPIPKGTVIVSTPPPAAPSSPTTGYGPPL